MKIKTGLLLLLVFGGLNFLGASPGYCQDIIALDAGVDHTVALRKGGTVWTWGLNGSGQLGDGSWTNKNVPTRVAVLSDIIQIAAGYYHSLAVKKDGTVWAWGANGNGQLGDGTTDNRSTPIQVKDPSDPTTFLTNVIAVAAGERHSLVLKADGTVRAWGSNGNGRLGDGTYTDNRNPVKVKDPTDASTFLTGVKAIAAGAAHSIALKTNKTVWTWGNRDYMQLGRGISNPAQNVAGQVPGLPNITAISGGLEHTVALAEGGGVWAAGRNLEGQLGDGTTIGSTLSPPIKLFVQVIDSTDPTGYLTGIIAIASDDRHTVAVKQNGSVYGWGWNYGGKLCDSITDNKITPIKLKDPSDPTAFLSGVYTATAGSNFNLMFKTDGSIWGCGYNYVGQLGTGAFSGGSEPISSPVQTVMPQLKLVYLWSLDYIVPGEEATFLVAYENLTETVLDQAVMVLNFPKTFKYLSSTEGGIHRDDQPTNQVFWKLGNIPAGTKGQVALKAEVPWGIPLHTTVMAAVELGARNTAPRFDIEEYLVWQPNLVSEIKLSPADVQQQLIQDPNLKALLQYATQTLGGYVFLNVAKRFEYRDGTGMTCFILMDTLRFGPAFLYSNGQAAFIEKLEGTKKIRFDSQGGYSEDLVDGSFQVWGRWAETTGILSESQASATAPNFGDAPPAQNKARCMMNCMVNHGFNNHLNLSLHMSNMTNDDLQKECKLCSESLPMFEIDPNALDVAACISCMTAWDNSIETYNGPAGECLMECNFNPNHHICTISDTKKFCYHAGPLAYFLGLTQGDTGEIAALQRCDPKTGTFEDKIWKRACNSALFQECIKGECVSETEGGGCEKFGPVPDTPLPLNLPGSISNDDLGGPAGCPTKFNNTARSQTRTARDPNIKSANVKGDVLPGETITYTVEYENLGAGTAYGVYILDKLDSNLDESTLVINNGGSYRGLTRLLGWDIGTVAPAGKGSVFFSVKVKAGLAAGTFIVNQADVYFPSANEITPTNAVIHQVKGLVANPQILASVSGSPLAITLTGKDSGSRPLSFQVTSPPGSGTLSGTAPSLTYTSAAEFIGQDTFSFTVNNGVETSGPALVKINVSFNPQDSKPPTVISAYPKASTSSVPLTGTPVQSNPNRFAPQITATFSEPLDASTVTGTTFTLNGGLTGLVLYDEFSRTAFYIPTKALNYSTTYTARLTTGIKDKKGNPLAAEYSWQFTTESLINLQVALPDLANEINFGDQAVNILSPAKTVSLASTGIQNLNIGTASVIGANSSDFKVVGDTCSGKTFTPSHDCTIQVAFQPVSAGQRTGSLSIPSNDPDLPSATILLKGEGIGSGPPWFIWLPLIMQP